MFDEQSSPEMAEGIAYCTRTRRDHVIDTFAPELRRSGDATRVMTDAVDLVTSWPTWEYLRASLGRSPAAATRVMVASLKSLLSCEDRGAVSTNGPRQGAPYQSPVRATP
jgi:hypothetical protein